MRIINRTTPPECWLAVIAAILYCSWPLSYLLNPSVGIHALASQLQSPNQPYNWLFILLDVLSGLLLIAVGIIQYAEHRRLRIGKVTIGIWNYIAFGIMVAIAAMVPIGCDPQTQVCGSIWHSPSIIVHGFCSIASVLCLLISLMLVAHDIYKQKSLARRHSVFILSILSAWLLFGVGSIIEIVLKIKNSLLQDFFITVCSLSIVAVVLYIERLGSRARITATVSED